MNTTKNINPAKVEMYLCFDGRCEEALEFYRGTLGAEIIFMMRFKDSPEPTNPGMCGAPGSENKVMHASFTIGETRLMASDGCCQGRPHFHGITLSIAAANEAEVDRITTALANGGEVKMPPAKTFFSPRFGMVTDRFGVSWMVLVAQ